jgi:hypothetical protein
MTALCQLVSNRTCIVVVQGDILTVLAKHHYNDPKLVNWIFQAKLDTLDHPDDLFIGTELRIHSPAASTAAGSGGESGRSRLAQQNPP